MNLVKALSSQIDSLGRRIIKFIRFGKDDVQTAIEASPYGIDSNAIKDLVAVYSETSEKGSPIIIGWLNKNQLAGKGELRMYSTDANGQQKFYTWLKNDGTMELGGNVDNAVRYAALDTAIQGFKIDIQAELVKIQTGLTGIGGVYVPGVLSVDLSAAKINEIKTL